MTRRRWGLPILATLATVGLVVADGGGDQDAQTTPTAQAGDAGGSVTIGGIQFENWDPHVSNHSQDAAHFAMVWRGLYHLDLTDSPAAAMAEGAPVISADGKTYTIKLKH